MNNATHLLHQAIYRLDSAQEELNRPDEDVMAFAICHQVRNSLGDMMSAFLITKGTDITEAVTLEDLRTMSEKFDERFKHIELSSMVCHPGQIDGEKCYCMDLEHVRACLKIANECKKIVQEANI